MDAACQFLCQQFIYYPVPLQAGLALENGGCQGHVKMRFAAFSPPYCGTHLKPFEAREFRAGGVLPWRRGGGPGAADPRPFHIVPLSHTRATSRAARSPMSCAICARFSSGNCAAW